MMPEECATCGRLLSTDAIINCPSCGAAVQRDADVPPRHAVPPATQPPSAPNTLTAPSHTPVPGRQGISRRALLVGAAGAAVVGRAGRAAGPPLPARPAP